MASSGKLITSADIVDGTIVNADVAAAAALALSKLAHVGAGNVLRSDGSANAAGPVATADLAADAVTKTTFGVGFNRTSTSATLELASTLNFTGGGGLCFLVFNVAILQTVAIGLQQLSFRLDGSGDTYIHYETAQAIGANAARAGEFALTSGAGLSGPHTITIHQATSAGSFAISPFRYWVREYKK
jgi:hypothetical protein